MKEFGVLLFMARNAGRFVRSDELYGTVWETGMLKDASALQSAILLMFGKRGR